MRDEINVERFIDAPAVKVWDALTDPQKLKQFFFGSDVVTDWTVGAPIRFRGEWRGKPYEDKGEIVDCQPSHRLAYTHWSPMSGTADSPANYHQVAFDLETVSDGTRVTLTQSRTDEAKPASPQSLGEFEKNWSNVLDQLKRVVEG